VRLKMTYLRPKNVRFYTIKHNLLVFRLITISYIASHVKSGHGSRWALYLGN